MQDNSDQELAGAPAELYDKGLYIKYKLFVNAFLYPSGIRDFVFREIQIKDGQRVLDAGCGHGILSKAVSDKIKKEGLKEVEQHAFDVSRDMLNAFRRMNLEGVDLRRLDVRDLPYDDDYFDLVITAAMLEYVPDIENGLASLKKCLKPGGRIYIFMSRKSSLNDFLFRPFGNPKCYSFEELESISAGSALKVIKRHQFRLKFFWLNVWGYVLEATKEQPG